MPDIADRASEETDRALELRTRDRQRKLVAKIDSALRRIDEGEYGYCEVTGEPISLKRLDARPIATMSLEAQERHERREKVHRDDWMTRLAERYPGYGFERHKGYGTPEHLAALERLGPIPDHRRSFAPGGQLGQR